jgi:hypothetical protein
MSVGTFLTSNVLSTSLDAHFWGSVHGMAGFRTICSEIYLIQILQAAEGPFAINFKLPKACIDIGHVSSLIWHIGLERLRSIHLAS